MAEQYLTHITQVVEGLGPLQNGGVKLESRHFFSGAVLNANGKTAPR
jgi:hypothetical protein